MSCTAQPSRTVPEDVDYNAILARFDILSKIAGG